MNIHICKMNKPQGFGIDGCRLIAFYHLKGREERKAKVVFQTGLTGDGIRFVVCSSCYHRG